MKAISIKQPWAGLIAQGLKTIEVRTWQTHYRGEILICSSQKPDFDTDFDVNFNRPPYFNGVTICKATIYKIEVFKPEHAAAACCGYAPGFFAWHLKNVQIVEHLHVKGKLNFFNVEI